MACGPRDIYNALIKAGFSTNQAVGAMANGIAESGLNAEARVIDSNGYYSNGIWQFNEASYPNSGSLVTGRCAADITAQVGLLKSSASGQALAGSSGAQVAGNFAQYFERCKTCDPGGASYQQRVANAATVSGWISSGKWPVSAAGLSGSGPAPGQAAQGAGPDCAFTLGGGKIGPVGLPSACLLKKATIRHAAGIALMGAGGTVSMVGVILLAAFAFRASGAARAASGVLGLVPSPGAQAASRAVASPRAAAAGRVQRRQAAARQSQRQQETRQRRGQQQAARAEGEVRNPRRLRPVRQAPPNYRPPADEGATRGEFHHEGGSR